MKMNKVLLAVGLLSAGMAVGQTQTTRPSSTTTNTSNYSTTDTQNYNSQNATMGTNSSTNKPTSTTGNPNNRTGSSATGTGSGTGTSGSYGNSSNTGSMGTGSSTNSSGGMGTSGSSTSGSYNSNSTGTGTNSMGTGGSSNTNSMGTGGSSNTNSMGTGTSTTTPSTSGGYNSNTGTSTSNNTYSTPSKSDPYKTKDYKNFAYGIYAGLNSTRFRGEDVDAENPAGRIGYQAGFFVRGGGRLYGQIGAEYFASSSNYFRPGDGQSAAAIRDQINIQYVQIPVYIGFKLTESDRGISAIRIQAGAEYANRISSTSGQFNLSNSEVKSGSFNALGQLGFDIGPFLIDLTYHHGLSDAVQITNFQGSARRILSASVGFKF